MYRWVVGGFVGWWLIGGEWLDAGVAGGGCVVGSGFDV